MKYSILDLVNLKAGQTYAEAYDDFIDMVQTAERLGFSRYWIAEHHNSKTIASSATQLLVLHALANSSGIRVGTGGVMLPNHSPYLVAEQYGTIERLYPGRLDLGLGRAPGTDLKTARVLRRTDNLYTDFERELAELDSYFAGTADVHAYPAEGARIPHYILGSSTDSAYLAARLGLPYSFASHFAPAEMEEAVRIYRSRFEPSGELREPYVVLGVNVAVADTDAEAERLFTSHTQAILGIVTNQASNGIQPPKESDAEVWRDYIAAEKVPHFGPIAFKLEDIVHREKAIVRQMTAVSLVGGQERVAAQLRELRGRVHLDEIMVNSLIYSQEDKRRSYELLAEVMRREFAA